VGRTQYASRVQNEKRNRTPNTEIPAQQSRNPTQESWRLEAVDCRL
jgi:hypothetical protein